jgi:hypothetical protein
MIYINSIIAKRLFLMQCAILSSIMKGKPFLFLDMEGPARLFLWTTVLNFIRSKGKVPLAVASSGIAALLLPGGRTPHSRFKIPLDIKQNSMCDIKKAHTSLN